MRPLLVTRPSPDAERTCAALARAGIEAEPVPLMTVDPTGDILPPLQPGDAVVFTSANGVRAWAASGGATDLPTFAVGESTAREAADIGFGDVTIGGGDVITLLPLLHASAARRFIHARGVHGTGDLAGILTGAGREVVTLPLYDARPVGSLPERLAAAAETGDADIAFFSPRTVRLFQSLCARHGPTPGLGKVTACCFSPAVEDASRSLPFGRFVTSDSPQLTAFVDMLKLRRT